MEDTPTIEEELFLLKSEVIALQSENAELQNQVHQLKYAKDQLEQFILSTEQQATDEGVSTKTSKKGRKVSEYQKAFQEFYKNNKNNNELLVDLKARLCSIGIMKESEKVPCHIIRLECKRLFDEQQHTNEFP